MCIHMWSMHTEIGTKCPWELLSPKFNACWDQDKFRNLNTFWSSESVCSFSYKVFGTQRSTCCRIWRRWRAGHPQRTNKLRAVKMWRQWRGHGDTVKSKNHNVKNNLWRPHVSQCCSRTLSCLTYDQPALRKVNCASSTLASRKRKQMRFCRRGKPRLREPFGRLSEYK